ncbi:MAG: LamG domain-containing protein, partial [Pirellulales bacterium]
MKTTMRTMLAAPFVAGGLMANSSDAGTILDFTFDSDPVCVTFDAQFTADSSGNMYDGFFSGGAANRSTVIAGSETLSGTNAVALMDGAVFVRRNFTYTVGTHGSYDRPDPHSTPEFNPIIGATDSWTLEAAIRVNSNSTAVSGILSNNGTGSEWWRRVENRTGPRFQFNGGTTHFQQIDDLDLNDGQWHHVAIVFARDNADPTSVTVTQYVEYEHVGSPSVLAGVGAVGNETRHIFIGGFAGNPVNRRFDGAIDRARITGEALSASEFYVIIPRGGFRRADRHGPQTARAAEAASLTPAPFNRERVPFMLMGGVPCKSWTSTARAS